MTEGRDGNCPYKEQPNICLPLGQLLQLFIPKYKLSMFKIPQL